MQQPAPGWTPTEVLQQRFVPELLGCAGMAQSSASVSAVNLLLVKVTAAVYWLMANRATPLTLANGSDTGEMSESI